MTHTVAILGAGIGAEHLKACRARLIADVHNRSQTAAPQSHGFTVTTLAIRAQEIAEA